MSQQDPSYVSRAESQLVDVPRKVRWLILSLSFEGLGIGYFTVFITAYLPQPGFSSDTVGLLIGLFGLVVLAAGVPLGLLSDKKGRKKIFLAGLFALPAELLVFALTSNFAYMVVSTVFIGISEAANLTTYNALIADQTSTQSRDKAFSFAFIVNVVSIGIGSTVPLSFPLVQNLLSLNTRVVHRSFMALFSLTTLASPLMATVLLKDCREIHHTAENSQSKKNLRMVLKFSGINSLIGLGTGLIIPLIPTWLYLRFQVPDTYSGPLLGTAAISVGLAAIASPRIAKRYGQVKSIALAQGVGTVFLLSLAFAPNPVLAGAFYLSRATFMNMASPVADSYLMGIIEPHERGLASAVNAVMWNLPNSASTILGGIILASGRYSLPFLLASLLCGLSISSFYVAFRNVRPRG